MDLPDSRSAQEYLEQFHALSLDMLCVASMDGFFKHVNPAFSRTLGYTEEILLSVPFFNFVHPDDIDATAAELAKLSAGQETIEFENRYRCSDGSYKWLSWTAAPNLESDVTYAAARDITHRKQMEARLLRAHRLESVGTLASKIVHDLNNILAPVLMAAELLPTLNPDAGPQSQRLFELLQNNAKRGSELVDQVVGFVKGAEPEHVPVQIRLVVADLQKMMAEAFPDNIQCQVVSEAQQSIVLGDPSQLYQVLLNLCVNARDAMLTGGTLTVKLTNEVSSAQVAAEHSRNSTGSYVALTVADTGSGIPASLQEQIFEPFFTTKQDHYGSGLGLATARSIVKEHRGTLTVDSEIGQGSTFTVLLPVIVD